MKKKKKRKLKLWFKLALFLIFIISILTTIYLIINSDKKNITIKKHIITTNELITNILSYDIDKNITKEFLLWINDNYSKETLLNITKELKNNNYNNNSWHKITGKSLIILQDLYQNKYENMSNITIKDIQTNEISLDFIGDVSLADDWYIAPKYDERGKKIYGILSEEVVKELNNANLTIANNEFTISNRGEKLRGKYYTFRASPSRIPIYNEMGVDLVTLANNHVYDYGKLAFLDMLESLDKYKMPHIGAGKNLDEASTPYYFIINGYKIAFVNANRSEKNILTPGATETEPGVVRCYDPTYFTNLIKNTKQESDFVIALIHWGKEDHHELEDVQIETSKKYIDAGADLIVGTHAHVLQGIDFYKDKAIIYNIGDFIFNHEDKDTMILKTIIDNDGNFNYYIIPAHQKDKYTYLLKEKDKEKVINDIIKYSNNNVNIDNNGKIMKK